MFVSSGRCVNWFEYHVKARDTARRIMLDAERAARRRVAVY